MNCVEKFKNKIKNMLKLFAYFLSNFLYSSVFWKGLTLVVSPLIALMEDQVLAMKRLNIDARYLDASQSRQQVNETLAAMTDPKSGLQLLYVTPERLAKSKRFMSKLEKLHSAGNLARIVIDEVHCCSQWGHDFRPGMQIMSSIS